MLQITKPKRKGGALSDHGGKLEVTLQWKDAPAFCMAECQDKKDKFQPDAFFEMFEVIRVEAGTLE